MTKQEICPSCGYPESHSIEEHKIRMGNYSYTVKCCETEYQRLQAAEDWKRQGIRAEAVAGLHRLSGVPEKFKDVLFPDYDTPSPSLALAYETTRAFAYNFPATSVLLIGPLGTGKTMLGCAALNHIINTRAVECRYIYTPDLFAMLRESIGDHTLSTIRVRELYQVPCVFLDDPGVATDTSWTQSLYMQIIDARYRENRPTFIASNEGMNKLEQILGARSLSRIVETYDIVELTGNDRRME